MPQFDSIVLSLLDLYLYTYTYTHDPIVAHERQGLRKYRYEVGTRLWKIVEFLEGRGLLLASPSWEPYTPTLLSLGYLLTVRPSNMRISRRKLQLSLKSYATGAGVTTRICDLTGADWIVHSADAKLLERDGSHRLPSFETIDYELLSSYPAYSSILLHIYIYMCARKILFHSFPFVSLRFSALKKKYLKIVSANIHGGSI